MSEMKSNVEADHRGERSLSFGEEIANSISHGLGLVLAIAAVPILILAALRVGKTSFVVGVSVFAASMVVLYLASTLYHSITHERAKRVARVLDHSAIFLLIAGTYTPFTLGVLRGPWGWTMLGIVWGLAAVGLALKAVAAKDTDALFHSIDSIDKACESCHLHYWYPNDKRAQQAAKEDGIVD